VLARLIGADERVVTIEDQAELHLWRELSDCISLEGRLPNTEGKGAITIQMLVHEALRMSPDRIVIGEVRGGEALDLLDAMNTGHPGSLSTIHADSPRETLPRLARLALRSSHAPRVETVISEVVNTIDLVLHAGIVRHSMTASEARMRRLTSVSFVAGLVDGQVAVRDLVTLAGDGGWHRVGSLQGLPERARAKLAAFSDPVGLLDGFDA
jgi:pilus assembly protein CpaF